MINPKNPYLRNDKGEAGTGIESNKCINLMAQLQPDGTLTWDPPKGDWVVLVFHHLLHRATNHPASPAIRKYFMLLSCKFYYQHDHGHHQCSKDNSSG